MTQHKKKNNPLNKAHTCTLIKRRIDVRRKRTKEVYKRKTKKNADSKQAFSLFSSPKKKGGNVKGESVFNESG